MRTFLTPLALFASVLSVHAQFTDATLPPLSSTDGGVISDGSSQSNWASSELQHYSTASGFVPPAAGGTDAWGHTWATTAPDLSALNTGGGSLRQIYLGPGDTTWMPAVGYTYLTSPTSVGNSFTLDYLSEEHSPSAFHFGDYANAQLVPLQGSTFDFWVDTTSGVYTLFNPANSQANFGATGQVLWTASPLLISTWNAVANDFEDVPTWIGSFVETPANSDAHSFTFALQEFVSSGSQTVPVPEPSTYGIIGAAALGLLVLKRKFTC